jgi:hypothetical protein
VPDGHAASQLNAVEPVIVMFIDTAFAVLGTPHEPLIAKFRVVPAPRAGPPFTLTALRVSTTRHGVSGKYEYCAEAVAAYRNERIREKPNEIASFLFI